MKEDDCTKWNVICIAAGAAVNVLLIAFGREIRCKVAGPTFDSQRYRIASAAYCLLIGTSDIAYWKGLWDVVNCWFGAENSVALVTMTLGMSSMILVGAARGAISCPLGIVLDTPATCFQADTFFGLGVRMMTRMTSRPWDELFPQTTIIIAGLAISIEEIRRFGGDRRHGGFRRVDVARRLDPGGCLRRGEICRRHSLSLDVSS